MIEFLWRWRIEIMWFGMNLPPVIPSHAGGNVLYPFRRNQYREFVRVFKMEPEFREQYLSDNTAIGIRLWVDGKWHGKRILYARPQWIMRRQMKRRINSYTKMVYRRDKEKMKIKSLEKDYKIVRERK